MQAPGGSFQSLLPVSPSPPAHREGGSPFSLPPQPQRRLTPLCTRDLHQKGTQLMAHFRKRALVGAVAICMGLLGGAARAAAPDVPDGQSRGRWFIQIDGSVAAFKAKAAAAGVEFTERFAYGRIWKGLSVEASADAVTVLGRLPGVKAVFPVL